MDIRLPERLPLEKVPAGTRLIRLHGQPRGPLWFGPAAGCLPVNRFDDPLGSFRVCYLGTTVEACFAETFLRNPPVRILSLSDLGRRSLAIVEVRKELRIVPLHGPALAQLGVTAEAASGSKYDTSRCWSHALWNHANRPDGIVYRSRHDDSALSIALFDRAKAKVRLLSDHSLVGDLELLSGLLKRYRLGLTN